MSPWAVGSKLGSRERQEMVAGDQDTHHSDCGVSSSGGRLSERAGPPRSMERKGWGGPPVGVEPLVFEAEE